MKFPCLLQILAIPGLLLCRLPRSVRVGVFCTNGCGIWVWKMCTLTTFIQHRLPEEYSGLDLSPGFPRFLLIWYFYNPRSETLFVFVKFWLYQALSCVNCLALSELGDCILHLSSDENFGLWVSQLPLNMVFLNPRGWLNFSWLSKVLAVPGLLPSYARRWAICTNLCGIDL